MPPCCSCICGANIRASGIINYSVTVGHLSFDIIIMVLLKSFKDRSIKSFCIILQQWWDGVIETKGYFRFLSFLPKVLLAIIIPILDNIYNEVALWLNDMGNVFYELCF